MSALAALLPGIRDLRNPFAIGAAWGAFLVFLLSPYWEDLLLSNSGLAELSSLISKVPDTYGIALTAFVIYLLGSIFQTLQGGLSKLVGQQLEKVSRWMTQKSFSGKRQSGRIFARTLDRLVDPNPPSVRSPIVDAIASAYSKTKAPVGAFLMFPPTYLLANLETAALQLWKAAPVQYQEYDRKKAESELRAGIVFPLLALNIILSQRINWWIFPILIAASFLLILEGHRLAIQAREMIATAIYLEEITPPILSGLVDDLKSMALPQSASIGVWTAATAVALDRRGEFDLSMEVIDEGEGFDEESDRNDFLAYLDKENKQLGELSRTRTMRHAAGINVMKPIYFH